MLSRIAESLYWIGRYVERAEDTSRLLDVHLSVLLDDPWAPEDVVCASLLSAMGHENVEVARRNEVLEFLAWDRESTSSVVGALYAARENTRRSREVVSSELWETINVTWHEATRPARQASPHSFLAWIRERTALINGTADSTLSRDEAWHFLVLGRSLERADMTARLVATRSIAGGPSWTHLMRSCGAYQTFLRTYHGAGSEENAAEFLLLDRLFPRSVYAALVTAESALQHLNPVQGRSGVSEEARRVIGRVAHGSGVPRRRRAARRPAGGDGADPTGLLGHERRSAAPLLPAEYGWCLGGGGCP